MKTRFRIRQQNNGEFYVEARTWYWPFWSLALWSDFVTGEPSSILFPKPMAQAHSYPTKEDAAKDIKKFLDFFHGRKDSGRNINVTIEDNVPND